MKNQMDLFSSHSAQNKLSNDPDAFGCCSHYRECSDSKCCIISSEEYSEHCLYRLKLESGSIFYSKKASEFNASYYENLCRKITALTPDAYTALCNILAKLEYFNRGSHSCCIRNEYIDEISSLEIFDIHSLGKDFVDICEVKDLRKIIMADATVGPLFDSARKKRTEDRKKDKNLPFWTSREFLIEFLNKEGLELLCRLTEPYRVIHIREDADRYLDEFWHDYLSPFADNYEYMASPLAVDGWLTNSEIKKEYVRYKSFSKNGADAGEDWKAKIRTESSTDMQESHNDPDIWKISDIGDFERTRERAEDIPSNLVSFNEITQSGTINGHFVSLSECDCLDFIINRKRRSPCKHMVRLLIELGADPAQMG